MNDCRSLFVTLELRRWDLDIDTKFVSVDVLLSTGNSDSHPCSSIVYQEGDGHGPVQDIAAEEGTDGALLYVAWLGES